MLEATAVCPPGCVVFELGLAGTPALDAQDLLAEVSPGLSTVFWTDAGSVAVCAHAIKNGATDFLEKSCSETSLTEALTDALTHSLRRRQELAEEAEAFELVERLTKRETEVFQLIARGFTNPEVARLLGMAVETVKVHRARVMRKLEATSVPDLVVVAQSTGLS